jgi:hypothetical protein
VDRIVVDYLGCPFDVVVSKFFCVFVFYFLNPLLKANDTN